MAKTTTKNSHAKARADIELIPLKILLFEIFFPIVYLNDSGTVPEPSAAPSFAAVFLGGPFPC